MNMMSVLEVFTVTEKGSLTKYHVKDTKYNIALDTVSVGGKTCSNPASNDRALSVLSTVASLCNDASLTKNQKTGEVEKIGEATEAALKTLVEKLDTKDPTDIHYVEKKIQGEWEKNFSLEFTRERKSMSVHCTSTANRKLNQLFVKGAPESILSRCDDYLSAEGKVQPLTAAKREAILAEVRSMGSNESALRCLGFAFVTTQAADKCRQATRVTLRSLRAR